MYKKGSKGWLKHFDFILLDMICLQIAFLLAYVIRHDSAQSLHSSTISEHGDFYGTAGYRCDVFL